jgi:hypothetical protein
MMSMHVKGARVTASHSRDNSQPGTSLVVDDSIMKRHLSSTQSIKQSKPLTQFTHQNILTPTKIQKTILLDSLEMKKFSTTKIQNSIDAGISKPPKPTPSKLVEKNKQFIQRVQVKQFDFGGYNSAPKKG